MKTHVIINPISGGGRTRVLIPHIVRIIASQIGNRFSAVVTRRPLDAARSAREAVANGATLIIAVGGDGTINEVVNGMLMNGHSAVPQCALGIISTGTGCGFAQSIGLPPSVEGQVGVILKGVPRTVDVGTIRFHNASGEISDRLFVNETQIGIGAEVVRRTPFNRKQCGGGLAYGLSTLSRVLQQPDQVIMIELGGTQTITRTLAGIVIGNGARTGGGMRLTPGAKLDDSLFDVLLIHEQSGWERIRNIPKIYAGRHIHAPGFSYCKVRRIGISSPESVAVSADGEMLGVLPSTVELLPAALRTFFPRIPQEERHARSKRKFPEIGI